MTPFTKILVATDFSEHSTEATGIAADLARRYSAELGFVHVFQPISYVLPESFVVYSAPQLTEILEGVDKALVAEKQKAIASGVRDASTEVLQGVPATEIVRCARDKGYDLIVLGTHGRTGIKHALMGSVAERVMRTAPCPVLTVCKR